MALLIIASVAFYIRRYGNGCLGAATDQHQGTEAASGLDSMAIDALPLLRFSEIKMHQLGQRELECAVCLHNFKDQDILRLLPNCCHVFHSDCIVPWLATHITCPVCRASLERTKLQGSSVSISSILGGISNAPRHWVVEIEEMSREEGEANRNSTRVKESRVGGSTRRGRIPRCHSTGELHLLGNSIKTNNRSTTLLKPSASASAFFLPLHQKNTLVGVFPKEISRKSDYICRLNKSNNLNRWGSLAIAKIARASPSLTL